MDLDDHFGSSVSMRPLFGHSSKFYRTDCNGTYSQGRGIQGNIHYKQVVGILEENIRDCHIGPCLCYMFHYSYSGHTFWSTTLHKIQVYNQCNLVPDFQEEHSPVHHIALYQCRTLHYSYSACSFWSSFPHKTPHYNQTPGLHIFRASEPLYLARGIDKTRYTWRSTYTLPQ